MSAGEPRREGAGQSVGPGLLVSVRSVEEAGEALEGGAGLIDVKEPRQGSLGRADTTVIQGVIELVQGRCPVSAALGEWLEDSSPVVTPGLAFGKWGLAGCGDCADWQIQLAKAPGQLTGAASGCLPVAVAYADWRRARSPRPEEVFAFAFHHGWKAFLLDTWGKDGSTLLDWLGLPEVIGLCRRGRRAGLRMALAGSLGPREIALLAPAFPDWFAVRGAVCQGGRQGRVWAGAVRQLADLIRAEAFPV